MLMLYHRARASLAVMMLLDLSRSGGGGRRGRIGESPKGVGRKPDWERGVGDLLIEGSLAVNGYAQGTEKVDSMGDFAGLDLGGLGEAAQHELAFIDEECRAMEGEIVQFGLVGALRMLQISFQMLRQICAVENGEEMRGLLVDELVVVLPLSGRAQSQRQMLQVTGNVTLPGPARLLGRLLDELQSLLQLLSRDGLGPLPANHPRRRPAILQPIHLSDRLPCTCSSPTFQFPTQRPNGPLADRSPIACLPVRNCTPRRRLRRRLSRKFSQCL
ncbi:hypothetical protein MARPO_0178s0013 [Marchantia polymorpha]|uniref:Uncharacterized protein n=1 Tax=Marchantia polymorpha TaxID=3197 RepID=A0A2R6W283_MARPO|nr:hypothetical protein MARPO_0178s0013 [Marchantia polymorpha]|eukprot:PTQ27962.1 hypothetical protein MARPO_0178s0013 [Marchantia polymorpha]